MNLLPGRLEKGKLYLPMTKEALDLPEMAQRISDRKVIVGLRPEHLHIVDEDQDAPVLSATAAMVEWLGADAFVHFEMEANNEDQLFVLPEELDRTITKNSKLQGVVRIDPSQRINRGDILRLQPDRDKLHIFDPEDNTCLLRSKKLGS